MELLTPAKLLHGRRIWRFTDTVSGNVMLCDWRFIDSIVYEEVGPTITFHFDKDVPGQGNNVTPLSCEVTGQEATDLVAFFSNTAHIAVDAAFDAG